MRRYSQRHNLTTLSELNVTPLLDLAFVLLIIFMITTPLLDNEMELVAPTSDTASTQIDPAKVRTVSIDRNEQIRVDEEEITLGELEAKMRQLNAEQRAAAVVVRPDKELGVQKLVDVMDVLQRAGITKVGVATRPKE